MITGHIFIATSLDGFIARDDGDISWLLERDDPTEDHGYDRFIADKDVIVMGRNTYESIRDIRPWPYNRPVVVLSATITEADVPEDISGRVRIVSMPSTQVMAFLEAEGKQRAYIDGGLVIQSFLQAGLISDIVITSVPILLGQGRRLFGELASDIPLIHKGTTSFPSGLVQSCYSIEK